MLLAGTPKLRKKNLKKENRGKTKEIQLGPGRTRDKRLKCCKMLRTSLSRELVRDNKILIFRVALEGKKIDKDKRILKKTTRTSFRS